MASRREAEAKLREVESRYLEESYALRSASEKKDFQLAALEAEKARLDAELKTAGSARVVQLEARLASASDELESQVKRATELAAALTAADSAKTALNAQLAEARANELAAEKQLASVSASADATAERLRKIEGDIDHYREEIRHAAATAAERAAENASLEARSREAERRLDDAMRELGRVALAGQVREHHAGQGGSDPKYA